MLSPAPTLRLAFTFLLAVSMLCARAAPPASTPPAESFFANPVMAAPVLSPNARYVAVRIGGPGRRDQLSVIDLGANTMKTVAVFSDVDVYEFQWVNNDRLVFNTTDRRRAWGDTEYALGMFAVDRDGKNFVTLVDRAGEGGRVIAGRGAIKSSRELPWHTFLMSQVGRQDSDEIYVENHNYEIDNHFWRTTSISLLRLNTRTSKATNLAVPPSSHGFLLDHDGEPRLAITHERDQQSIHHRERGSDEWRKLTSFNAYTGAAGAFSPMAFGPDGSLFVRTNGGKDKESIHSYDLASGKISAAPIVVTEGYDFSGHLVLSGGKLLGLKVVTDAAGMVWMDPKMKAVQKEIDSRLTSTVNLVSVAARPELPVVLVTAYSDVHPESFLLYNTETKAITRIGSAYPAIKPEQMGRQEPVRYKARDGMEIPALLTLPPGGRRDKLPMVVLVHGGPHARAAIWGFNPEVQFLATRGYAVLEPDFRGSTGYGGAHFHAGWKQWGLAMQDDVADGVQWAVAKGYADPGRVCIAGASYGGYSALMGLVNDPGLYKCGVSWLGVTDIGLLFTGTWSVAPDIPAAFRKYGMPELIGNQDTDAARFKATSPLHQAARITQPLLLAYGGADKRVPLHHGEKFRAAVKKTNPDVEWIEYHAEAHGWALPENRIDFWTRVEKFLNRNIGTP
jgi:dipeptidyl aminopeptidase/acylaminoacyl peptidase